MVFGLTIFFHQVVLTNGQNHPSAHKAVISTRLNYRPHYVTEGFSWCREILCASLGNSTMRRETFFNILASDTLKKRNTNPIFAKNMLNRVYKTTIFKHISHSRISKAGSIHI